ncbi:MAG: UTP--glucose-1-phosphate uridylyltransferase [Dehalococcoidia bacterium]
MRPVRKAVILAAGMGSRMLPATKAVPKEMLPIVDKPLLQYAVEEAAAASIEEICFVIAEGKEAVREHFGTGGRVAGLLRAKGDEASYRLVERAGELARFSYVMQDVPLGPAHALNCARAFFAGEPVALFFADDLILGPTPCIGELVEAYQATGGSVIGVEEVTSDQVPSYGIVDPAGDGNPMPLRGLVEKPKVEDAPSNLGIVGRYVLSPSAAEHIDRSRPSAAGKEHYVTDVLVSQLAAGEPVSALRFKGVRYDTGRPLGYLVANVAAAFEREALRQPLTDRLRAFLGG